MRAAGIPVGPGAVLDALDALRVAGVGARADFYWTLHAVFVKRHEHTQLFDQAFGIFFRRRDYLDKLMASLVAQAPPREEEAPRPGAQRIEDALFSGLRELEREAREIEIDARLTVSDRELLQKKDFAQMSAAEIAAAKAAIKRLVLSLDQIKTRRLAPHPRGHIIDMRRTLRASLKAGGALIDLKFLGPKTRQPPIVALLDISGSMSQYTRLFLHFLHAVTDARKRVHTFLFGTRLTNVTRALEAEGPRRGARQCDRQRRRLVGRHAHRDVAAHVQQALGAPRAHARRDRAADHRRARARRRRGTRIRDRPAASLLPAADLAQPALAVFGASRPRRAASDRCCRMLTNCVRFTIWRPWEIWSARCHRMADGPGIRRNGSTELHKLRREQAMATLATDDDILKAAEDWRKAGKGVALATVVETWGSAPRPVGSNLVIDDEGNFLGSVSGGCVEGAVVTEALDVIESGKPKTLEFGVADETAWKVGLSCGGTIRVYVEKVE